MADLAGNLLCCTQGSVRNYTFTTGSSASSTALQVTSVSPANGLTAIPINSDVTIQFNEPVDTETFGAITLTPANSTPFLLGTNDNHTIYLYGGLLPNTLYTLSVQGVTDQAGNAMTAPFTSTFTTGADAYLFNTDVSVTPSSEATGVSTSTTIKALYTYRLNPLSVSAAALTLSNNSNNNLVAGTISLSSNNMLVTFTPNSALSPGTVYKIQINSNSQLTDLIGQSTPSLSSLFTTGSK